MYQIKPLAIADCLEIIPQSYSDKRGDSIKPYHNSSFQKLGLPTNFQEELHVFNHGQVLRGMHFQKPPYAQAKLVTCLQGALLDVAIDLRENSPTYGQYVAIELDSQKHNMVYIPDGFAHGYLTLSQETIVVYKMSQEYHPETEDGIRWDSFGFDWNGIKAPTMSDKDKNWQSLQTYMAKN